ncbi:MAG: biopolymer transporter ExbB [Micavibrio sp.]|nr:biopolymer transporter ExbB [Micavibrio sp.]|tara:strand:+ start:201 stop:1040 length:840 start_codon:yes stop_codon:yes gene_type:complete
MAKTDNEMNNQADINIRIVKPKVSLDFNTVFGLVLTFVLIAGAIFIGRSNANFFNIPSVMIVILGTMTVTSISYTWEEVKSAGRILGQSLFRKKLDPQIMARQLLDISVLTKKKGVLALAGIDGELKKDKHLRKAAMIVTDGYSTDDVERVLAQELDALVERHRRSASILRRGAEVAPAMGLIGTLIGLVQMLADLENPETIGPSMAVALLTTFYGAILGTAVLAPMAAKLERNSNDEAMIHTLVLIAMTSISRQDNPRRLEMLLNSELPPNHRIRYFD